MPSHAQQIAEADMRAAIESIANNIAVHYFDIEKGGQIASYIMTRYHEGDFNKTVNWQQFDDRITKSLQGYSKDGHLFVRCNPGVVKTLRHPSEGSQGNLNANGRNIANYGFTETTIMDGNIGYLKIAAINLTRESLPTLRKAMDYLQDTRALIIDLRDNGGGSSGVGPVLESCFLPAGMPLLEFISREGAAHTDSTMVSPTGKVYEKPLYILVNKKTASAAEAFTFAMQQHKRASIVGERTAGAANMNEYFALNDDNYLSVSTASPRLPGKRGSWEGKGIVPDIKTRTDDPVAELFGRLNKN